MNITYLCNVKAYGTRNTTKTNGFVLKVSVPLERVRINPFLFIMNNLNEIWKDVPGYEWFYQASNLGNIRSLDRLLTTRGKSDWLRKGKQLKGRNDGYKYLAVILYDKHKIKKSFKIHKLIAMTFLDHVPNGMKDIIDHIDGNKKNNNVLNLQITTNRHNCAKCKTNKTSKYTGVHLRKGANTWVAQIYINGIRKHLGTFKDELQASLAYKKEYDKQILKNETETRHSLHGFKKKVIKLDTFRNNAKA